MKKCNWPKYCNAQCARCATNSACLAQVPEESDDGYVLPMSWMRTHGYQTGLLTSAENAVHGRMRLSREVENRLIAWLRWPGHKGGPPELVERMSVAMGMSSRRVIDDLVTLARSHGRSIYVHPLDGTPVAGLVADVRRGLNDKLSEGYLTLYEIEPDWPALAVITDHLTERGMWSAVHGWRPTEDALAAQGDRTSYVHTVSIHGLTKHTDRNIRQRLQESLDGGWVVDLPSVEYEWRILAIRGDVAFVIDIPADVHVVAELALQHMRWTWRRWTVLEAPEETVAAAREYAEQSQRTIERMTRAMGVPERYLT